MPEITTNVYISDVRGRCQQVSLKWRDFDTI